MKLYISIDMEGMMGTIDWKQEDNYRGKVREYIYRQMGWVIEGIDRSSRNDDIDEIVIADSHAFGDNLLYDFTEIDDRISLVSGYPRPQYMMPAFDESFDLVFFIGYHAGVGALHGVMDHTYSSRRIHNMWMNGKSMNESLLNASYAGYYNVPVGLVIGDDALKKELLREDAMPWIKYVETKQSIAKFAAKLKPIGRIKAETIKAVKDVLDSDYKNIPVLKFPSPTTLKIEFNNTAMADVASLMPYTKRIDGRTLEFTDNDYKVIFDGMMTLVMLSSAAN